MTPATVKAGPAMAQARAGHAAVRLSNGRVLIMGGTVPFTGTCGMACNSPSTASVEVYDPSTGKFSPNGSLAQPRTGGAALLLHDGRVLVSGGYGPGGYFNTIELYDPAQGSSVVVKPPAGKQELPADPAVVVLADGRVLVAGGGDDLLNTTSNATLIFDPASGGFSNGPLMAEPRQGATATLLEDGRVLIAGGHYDDGHGYIYWNSNAELIDPSHPLSQFPLSVSQFPSTSTLLSDGRVLVTEWGPYDSGASCITPVVSEVFDPKTGRFTPAGPMSTPRTGSAAIKIPDGRVLLFGGVDSNCAALGTVEAFDPDSWAFQVIAAGISGSSVTLLDDGEILIAGGESEFDTAAATWVLTP